MTLGGSYVRQCWGDRGPHRRCLNRVPPDADHIGLCAVCRERLTGQPADEIVRSIRDDAIDGILDSEAAL